MIALATFGTNQKDAMLGANLLITYDQPMINGYSNHLVALERRLQVMRIQIADPFHQATLPKVVSPDNERDIT